MNVNNQETAISQAQREVWDMKARLYEQVQALALEQAIQALLVHAQATVKQLTQEGKLKIPSPSGQISL